MNAIIQGLGLGGRYTTAMRSCVGPESLNVRCSNDRAGEMEMSLVLMFCWQTTLIPPPRASAHGVLW